MFVNETRNPLQCLHDFLADCQVIVNCFSKSHLLNAKLTERQQAVKPKALPKLARQCATRWCSIRRSLCGARGERERERERGILFYLGAVKRF
jgi:hypothetical protein